MFREQIAAGGPVTVTDPEMQRYFMTVPEAVQLVLQAGALARAGGVYFLDMGQPVLIAQLAEDVIRLSGLRPHVDITIEYTGVRPGEKLFEELATEGEDTQPTAHPKVFVATATAAGRSGTSGGWRERAALRSSRSDASGPVPVSCADLRGRPGTLTRASNVPGRVR